MNARLGVPRDALSVGWLRKREVDDVAVAKEPVRAAILRVDVRPGEAVDVETGVRTTLHVEECLGEDVAGFLGEVIRVAVVFAVDVTEIF